LRVFNHHHHVSRNGGISNLGCQAKEKTITTNKEKYVGENIIIAVHVFYMFVLLLRLESKLCLLKEIKRQIYGIACVERHVKKELNRD